MGAINEALFAGGENIASLIREQLPEARPWVPRQHEHLAHPDCREAKFWCLLVGANLGARVLVPALKSGAELIGR